jgi:O-antigen/teichoic acid export membrane protein
LNKKNIYLLSQNVFSLFIVKGIDLVLTLFLIPFLILKVGIINYGTYAFAMALMLFFVNVLNYGFDLSAVRELAIHKENKAKISEIVSKVISVKLFLIIILYVIVAGLVFFIPRFREYKEMYLFASLILVGDLFSVRWFFLGLEKMKFISIMSTFATTVYVIVAVNIIKAPSDFIYIPLAESIGMFLVSLGSLFWVIRAYGVNFRLFSLNQIFQYLRLNFSNFVSLMLPSTYGITSIFLVGVFGFPSDVTIMQVGMKFTSAFSTVNTILSAVFYPMVNREKRNIR